MTIFYHRVSQKSSVQLGWKYAILTELLGILGVKNGLISLRNKPKYTIYCVLIFIDHYLVALGLRIFA